MTNGVALYERVGAQRKFPFGKVGGEPLLVLADVLPAFLFSQDILHHRVTLVLQFLTVVFGKSHLRCWGAPTDYRALGYRMAGQLTTFVYFLLVSVIFVCLVVWFVVLWLIFVSLILCLKSVS